MTASGAIAGLDIGSARISCLIGVPEAEDGLVRVLGGASVPCRGLKGGVVIDIPEAARTVRRVIEEAEACANMTVASVRLAARGGHLKSFNNRGALNIARTDKEITAADVSAVLTNAKAVPSLSSDQEILNVVSQGFTLDRQGGVPHPVGMEGSLLEADVHIITASSGQLTNLFKTIAQAGFEMEEVVYGLLAAGELMVTPEEKDLGCLFVDIGGESVSMGVYSEGAVRYTKELQIGADFITRDLASGLRTTRATAERIKLEHGIAHPALLNGDGDKEVEYQGMDGRTPNRIRLSAMMEFILPRVEEIFSIIAEELQNSSYADLVIPGGAVLTGGGSLLRGTEQAAEQILNLPVRLARPHPDHFIADDKWLAPTYATALGLLHACGTARWEMGSRRVVSRNKPAWMRRFMGMVEDLF